MDEFAGKYACHSSEKARRELGDTHLPGRETVQRTVAWLVQHGFVNEQRRAMIVKTLPA